MSAPDPSGTPIAPPADKAGEWTSYVERYRARQGEGDVEGRVSGAVVVEETGGAKTLTQPPLPPSHKTEAKQAAAERSRAAAARGPFARALAKLVPKQLRRGGGGGQAYAPAARGAGVESLAEDKRE